MRSPILYSTSRGVVGGSGCGGGVEGEEPEATEDEVEVGERAGGARGRAIKSFSRSCDFFSLSFLCVALF